MCLLAFGGVGILIVGLAAKDLLSNFFGDMMIFDRPFRFRWAIKSPDRNIEYSRKDRMAINCCSNILKMFYIFGQAFSSIIVENATRMSNRRINETIGIRYDDLDKMKSIIDDVSKLLHNDSTIDPISESESLF